MKKLTKRIIIFFSSILFVLLQPYVIGERVETIHELSDVRFGFPIPYTSQGMHVSPIESDLPIMVKMSDPKEGDYFSLLYLLIDVVIVFISLLLLSNFWNKFVEYMNKK